MLALDGCLQRFICLASMDRWPAGYVCLSFADLAVNVCSSLSKVLTSGERLDGISAAGCACVRV
jgi:hypothetical protein